MPASAEMKKPEKPAVVPIITLSGTIGTEQDAIRLLRFLDLVEVGEGGGTYTGGWRFHFKSGTKAEIDERVQALIVLEMTPRYAERVEARIGLSVSSAESRDVAVEIGAKIAGEIQEAFRNFGKLRVDMDEESSQ